MPEFLLFFSFAVYSCVQSFSGSCFGVPRVRHVLARGALIHKEWVDPFCVYNLSLSRIFWDTAQYVHVALQPGVWNKLCWSPEYLQDEDW